MSNDQPVKNSDVRALILKEFYDQEMQGQFRGFDAEVFAVRSSVPLRQVQVNLKYLVDMGLISGQYVLGTDVPIVMGITALGLDVVDDPQKFRGRFEINFNQQTIEISGQNFGQIAQGQQGSAISQTQTVNTFQDAERLIETREGLSEDEKGQLKERMKEIEEEMNKHPISLERIKSLLEPLRKYAWLYPLIVDFVGRLLKSILSPSGSA